MGTFRITVEIADPLGQHFEAVEMLVDTGATFTKAPGTCWNGWASRWRDSIPPNSPTAAAWNGPGGGP